MKYLINEEIDKRKWDNTVIDSVNGKITFFSWYLDAVSPNFSALVNDDYSWIFPLPEKKKFIIKYLIQPFACQQCGLVYLNQNFNFISTLDDCIEYIIDHYHLFDFNINTDTIINDKIVTVDNRNLILKLGRSYNEIFSSFSTNTKRNLKKSLNEGVVVKKINNSDEVIDLFVKDKGRQVGWTEDKSAILRRIFSLAGKCADIKVYGAYLNDKLISGACFIGFCGKWTFLFSGNSASGKETGAMFYVIDRFICDYCNDSLFLDFEGSNNNGLYRFYKSFGSDEQKYVRIMSKIMSVIKPSN